jgi:hypothetical protein
VEEFSVRSYYSEIHFCSFTASSLNICLPKIIQRSLSFDTRLVTAYSRSLTVRPHFLEIRPYPMGIDMLRQLRARRRYLAPIILGTVYLAQYFGVLEDRFSVQDGFVYQLEEGNMSHPVEYLHNSAMNQFDALLARQSLTAVEAMLKYRRKYGREPPPGFEKWFSFAKDHASPIIDDYDEMMRSLEPFWKMTPAEFVRLLERAIPNESDGYVKKCQVVKGTLKDCGRPNWAGVFSQYLGTALHDIPDMVFLCNFLDEPVVLQRHSVDENGARYNDDKLEWSSYRHQPIWPHVQEVCAKMDEAAVTEHYSKESSPHVDFVSNTTQGTNLCAHPEFYQIHGYLASCVSSFHVNFNVPILSLAAPYPFGDILLPAPSYSWSQFSYSGWRDLPWQRKANSLYWAGSSSGSYTYDSTWVHHHRQRLVLLGSGTAVEEGKMFSYLRKLNNRWLPYITSQFDKSLYHVAMTKIWECDEPACSEQEAAFRPRQESKSAPFHHKYVFDIDGNSLSGRFYRLLASNSAVLKTTIFKEWHDERLVPWLHYIPVSLGLEELPELMRFLATTDEGREIGRRVAKAGKSWHGKGLREVDRGVYLYRLLLELAWLQNSQRVIDAR